MASIRETADVRAVLIDLDGTLLDTAGDLAVAANRTLAALGLPPRTVDEVRTYVGKGVRRLVERCLTGDLERRAEPALLERAMAIYSPAYLEESGRHSAPYPGVIEGLERMGARYALGCVTNKLRRFTVPLLERMELFSRFGTLVCGDDLARAKPDPLPFLHAAQALGAEPAQCVVIGDSDNDVLAARAAGMRVLCVAYGYTEGKPVESLGADAVVRDFRDAADWIMLRG